MENILTVKNNITNYSEELNILVAKCEEIITEAPALYQKFDDAVDRLKVVNSDKINPDRINYYAITQRLDRCEDIKKEKDFEGKIQRFKTEMLNLNNENISDKEKYEKLKSQPFLLKDASSAYSREIHHGECLIESLKFVIQKHKIRNSFTDYLELQIIKILEYIKHKKARTVRTEKTKFAITNKKGE